MNAMSAEDLGAGASGTRARRRFIPTPALILVMAMHGGLPSAQAAETTVKNDSATDGSLTTVCPCFVPGEQTAAWLTSPCDGNIVGIQVFWKSTFGGAPDSTELSLGLFGAGTFPTPGAALANDVGGPAVIAGPMLTDGIYNEYRFLTDGTTPISVPVTAGQTFVASLEYVNSNAGGPPTVPSTVFDHDGCQPGKNAAFTVPGGWADACSLGVTGDWVIRAIVDCQTTLFVPLLPGIVDGIDHDIRKQRFLSINPHNPVATTRMRLSLLNNGCSTTGKQCTDDASCTACDAGSGNAGDACDNNNQCESGLCVVSGETCEENSPPVVLGFILDPVEAGNDAPLGTLIAGVGADPGFRVWDETLVHITDCEVAPGRVYRVEMEDINAPGLFSRLDMRTSIKPDTKDWGDIVGTFNGTEWTAGSLILNVDDVNAIIKFLELRPFAPHVTRVELLSAKGPLFNNMDVNADELAQIIRCFAGEKYPPLPMVLGGYPDLQAGGLLTDCPPN